MTNHLSQRMSRAKTEFIALAILAPLAFVLGVLLIRWPGGAPAAESLIPIPAAATAAAPVTSLPAASSPIATVSLVVESPAGVQHALVSPVDGMTAADALLAAHAAGRLTADVKDFGGELGIFVEALNGLANDPPSNQYWLLYINGVKSAVGASSALVRAGDTVTWKYEKAEQAE